MRDKISLVLLMAFYGTISFALKNYHMSAENAAIFRGAFGLPVILAVKLLFQRTLPKNVPRGEIFRMILCGAVTMVFWIGTNYAYEYAPVSIATLLLYFAPSIVMVASPALFHETRTRKQTVCFVVSTAGMILIAGVHGLGTVDGKLVAGIVCSLLIAVCYASIQLLNKSITHVNGIDKTVVEIAVATALVLAYHMARGGIRLEPETPKGWLALFALGGLYTGLAYCLNYYLINRMSGQEYAILTYMDPLVAMLVSVLYWKEAVTPVQIAGAALLLGGAIANEITLPGKEKA